MKIYRFCLSFVPVILLMGCATSPATLKTSTATSSENVVSLSTASESTSTQQASIANTHTFFYQLHPEGDPMVVARFFQNRPQLKATLIFPPKYFSNADKKPALDIFKALISSGQIEVALTLENEPILPLLGDLQRSSPNIKRWGFNYSWPDDISEQVAAGSSRYQLRWNDLPKGFFPPYQALSDDVISTLKRFRLDWVMGPATEQPVIFHSEGMVIFCPTELRYDTLLSTGSFEVAAKAFAMQLNGNNIIYVDAGKLNDPNNELPFLRQLETHIRSNENLGYKASELAEFIVNNNLAESLIQLPQQDWSYWTSSNKQKAAWQALSQARQALDNYQNSGRANLTKLDAAKAELVSAQSGPFLKSLADPAQTSSLNEKTFTATLANIYRLSGAQVPSSIHSLFTRLRIEKIRLAPTDPERPFFQEGQREATWNDAIGDDNGGGTLITPIGNYPKGAFDLDQFQVSWSEDYVVFKITTTGAFPTGTLPLRPGFDIYIDVNRLSNAGEQQPFRQRGNSAIDRDAAWEYAIVVYPKECGLYTAVPGAENRLIASPSIKQSANGFEFQLSRSLLRGDPKNWRYTIALFAAEPPTTGATIRPSMVLVNPTSRNFGGATSGRQSIVYIDVLCPPLDQQQIYSGTSSGGKLVLPFVESQ